MKYLKSYFQQHIMIRYASILLVVTFLSILFIQYTLKQSYTEQLRNNILQSEKKSMDNMAMNLDAQMKPYLNILYDTATDRQLLTYVADMGQDEKLNSKDRMRVREFLKRKVMYSNKFLALMVIGENGDQIEYNKMDWAQIREKDVFEDEDAMNLYERVKETGTVQVFFGERQKEAATVLHIGVPLVGDQMAKEKVFSIVAATLDVDFLHDFFSENSGEYVENYLVDQNGRILMCKEENRIGDTFSKPISEQEYIVLEKKVNQLDWKLYSRINQAEMLKSSFKTTSTVSLIYIILTVFITFFAIVVLRCITEPLRTLTKNMNDIGKGNLGIRMEVKGQDEVWQVVEKFNIMMEALENYYELNEQQYQSMLEMQKREQEAEFEVLESYINSHFIFNTLNVINYQLLEAGNQNASMMIKRLANIMRYAFNSRLQYIYLYQEMLWVEQYLFLQSECDGGKTQFEVLVDEKVSDCAFRKMILQPFVENSIMHGLKGRENGKILVQAKSVDDGQVQILIEDNGCGIPEEKQEKIMYFIENPDKMTTEGIGIVNVVTRLKYYYGEKMKFQITSAKGEGTRIEIRIPYMKL